MAMADAGVDGGRGRPPVGSKTVVPGLDRPKNALAQGGPIRRGGALAGDSSLVARPTIGKQARLGVDGGRGRVVAQGLATEDKLPEGRAPTGAGERRRLRVRMHVFRDSVC